MYIYVDVLYVYTHDGHIKRLVRHTNAYVCIYKALKEICIYTNIYIHHAYIMYVSMYIPKKCMSCIRQLML